MSEYEHTQTGPWKYVLYAIAALELCLAWALSTGAGLAALFLVIAAGCFLLAQSIAWLRVRDEGPAITVSFGPIRLLGRRVSYEDIESVEADQSNWLDGWGLHYRPGHGWIYNIWGFDCVRLRLTNGRILRIGTDDQQNLIDFLRTRIGRLRTI